MNCILAQGMGNRLLFLILTIGLGIAPPRLARSSLLESSRHVTVGLAPPRVRFWR